MSQQRRPHIIKLFIVYMFTFIYHTDISVGRLQSGGWSQQSQQLGNQTNPSQIIDHLATKLQDPVVYYHSLENIHTHKIMKRLISKQVMQGCLIHILVFWELEWRNKDFGCLCFSQFTTKNNICHYQFFVLLKVKAISPNCAHAGYKCPIQSDVQ